MELAMDLAKEYDKPFADLTDELQQTILNQATENTRQRVKSI